MDLRVWGCSEIFLPYRRKKVGSKWLILKIFFVSFHCYSSNSQLIPINFQQCWIKVYQLRIISNTTTTQLSEICTPSWRDIMWLQLMKDLLEFWTGKWNIRSVKQGSRCIIQLWITHYPFLGFLTVSRLFSGGPQSDI